MASSRSKSRRRNPGRHRQPNGFIRTLMLGAAIVIIPAVVLAGGGYLAYQHLNTEAIDTAFCYERDDQEQVAVFVDFSLTKHLSASQRRDVGNKLNQTFNSLPPNGRISVFTTANDITASINEPVFSQCRPPKSASEQDSIGAPETSGAKLDRQYSKAEEQFAAFVETLATRSVQDDLLANSSPILEQIQGISRYPFASSLSRLIAITDGLNNSPSGRFCAKKGHLPKFKTFAAKKNYPFIAPDDFNGADVDILLMEGYTLPSDALPFCKGHYELRNFWVSYFEANGAGSVRLTPLGYGAGQ